MATDKSRSQYQGLLLHDPRLRDTSCLWSAQSSYTQAGPRPGTPAPAGASQMVLQATGEASGDTVEILAQRAGMPGPGGGGIVWKTTGNYRGWDVPSVVHGWEAVVWTDGGIGSDIKAVGAPHAITLDDETVLVAAQVRYSTGVTTTYHVYVWTRDPDTGAWTSQSVYHQSGAPTSGFWPCFLPLPSGRVLLYYQIERASGDETQVQMQYSDDSGTTWTVGAAEVLSSPMDSSGSSGAAAPGGTPWRMRAAYKDGQALLLISYRWHDTDAATYDTDESYYQFASSDLGCTFDPVGDPWDGDSGGDEGGAYHELLVLGGRFVMLFIGINRSDRPVYRAVSNAFERLADQAPTETGLLGTWAHNVTTDADYYSDGELAAWVDRDGVAYIVGRQVDATDEIVIARSIDAGETWEMLGTSDYSIGDPVGKVFDFDDSSTYLTNLCITPQGGRALLLHGWAANPGNEDNSLGCAYLGGWSTVTMPSTSSARSDKVQASWLATWIPIEIPSDMGWTGVGAGTDTLTAGYLSLSTAATSRSYSRNPPGTIAEGMVVRLACKVTSGGSLTSDAIGCRLRLADGTHDYDISVRVRLNAGNHEYRLYDNNAGAAVGSDVIITGTDGVDILIAFGTRSVATWYLARSLGTDRKYAAGPASTSLTDDAATPAANHLLQWGQVTASTSDSRWYELHYVSDEYTGFSVQDLSQGQTNPDDLYARAISSEYLWIDSGLRLRAIDGPMLAGESWTIPTRYDYGIERIFPSVSASPRVRWRSTSTAQQTIALAFDASLLGTVESCLGNSAIGLFLTGINWRTGTWQGYDVDTAAWVTIATLDTATGMTGLDWTRKGNTVIPAVAGAGDQPYLNLQEAGGWILGYNGSTFRRISANTEGKWDRTSGTIKRPTLILADVAGGDPTSGGSAYLMPTEYAVIAFTAATYAGYRLVIDSQSTVESYFEIGDYVLGPVALFGSDYAWGRSIETEPGTEVSESRDRTTRSRVLAPPRRTVQFSWVDGVEMTALQAGDPDYVLPSTTGGIEPAASVGDIPYVLDGLVRLLDGPHRPVVYLPRIPKGPNDVVHLNRRHQFLYGRTTGTVSVENVLGSELTSELSRVGSIAIREET